MKRMKQWLGLTLLGLMLTACQTNPTPTTETTTNIVACNAFQIIRFSKANDSKGTIEQVKGHNAAYRSVCGDKHGQKDAGEGSNPK